MHGPGAAGGIVDVVRVDPDQYGTRIQFAGSADPSDEVRFLDGVPADGAFVATYHRGEATTAVLAMNSPRQFTRLRRRLARAAQPVP